MLLEARLDRERFELRERDHTIREQITNEICAAASQAIDALAGQVRRMPDELSGRFCGLEAMAIYKLFKSELHQRFQRAHESLQKLQAQSRRKTKRPKEGETVQNVIRFRKAV